MMDADKPSTEFIATVVKDDQKQQTPPPVRTKTTPIVTDNVKERWRQFLETLTKQRPIQRSTCPRMTDREIAGVEIMRKIIIGTLRVALREQTPPPPASMMRIDLVAKWREKWESDLAKASDLDDLWFIIGEHDVCPVCYLPRTEQFRWHNYRDVPCACGPNEGRIEAEMREALRQSPPTR